MEASYDIVIIGAGPGGYVAAIRAAQLGLKACVIEKDKPGGVCLNIGCIPSKSLIHQASLVLGASELSELGATVDLSGLDYGKAFAASRKASERLSKGVQFLLKKNGIDYKVGSARLESPRTVVLSDGSSIKGKAILIATGSSPRQLKAFPFDEQTVLSSSGALMRKDLPKRVIILGAGAIGMELGFVWNAFGTDVTIVEALDRVLPVEDAEAAAVVRKAFESRGVRFIVGAMATGMEGLGTDKKEGVRVSLSAAQGTSVETGSKESIPDTLEADALLVAVGRVPNTSGLGLEELGITIDNGFIRTGDHYQTSAAGVYAIGDVVDTPLLAHVASKEGEIAVEHIASVLRGGEHPSELRVDPSTVPSAVYCEPELASFGLSADKAAADGITHAVYSFPYRGIGKAVAIGKPEGFAKLVYQAQSGEILGATIVGERAADVIHELLLARRSELTVDDIADMMHAHPTIAELVMEAAKGSLGRAVHA